MPTLFRFLKIGAAVALAVYLAMLALVYLVQPAKRPMTVPVDLNRVQHS
jgi:hypothetical protein